MPRTVSGDTQRDDDLLGSDGHYYWGKRGDLVPNTLPADIDVNDAFLARGQERYNIYCAPCHAQHGKGNGTVASRLTIAPPDFHDDTRLKMPLSHIFRIITHGKPLPEDGGGPGAKLNMPSYAAQIVTFTFPHIGNVGANPEDIESSVEGAVGCVVREDVTEPSNFRSAQCFTEWMEANGKIGISGVDTRALTRRIRLSGAPNAVIAHNAEGKFDLKALQAKAQGWAGLEGMDLAERVTREALEDWAGGDWALGEHFGAMQEETHAFINSVGQRRQDPILATGREGFDVLVVSRAVDESAAGGEVVPISWGI